MIFIVPADKVQIPTPKIGQVVTFTYQHRTYTDEPLNPCIAKVRNDVLWDDIVQFQQTWHFNSNFISRFIIIIVIVFTNCIGKRGRGVNF